MDILLGDQLELKRQVSELDRLDSFVSYQIKGDPTQLLFSWSRQARLRAELHDFLFFRGELDVLLDVKVTGGVAVSIDEDPTHVTKRSVSPKKMLSAAAGPNERDERGSPKKMVGERKTMRRVSDLFAETMGEFDQFSLSNDMSF
jgi:hypothetical protein